MDLRQEYGEKVGPNSWIMRDLFRTAMLTYGAHYGMACAPQQLKSSGIRNMLKRAWVSQGLMKQKDGNLYEFKSSHGFRKRFKTQCELAGVKPINIEFMLGHDTGITGSYYPPTDQELLADYLKAVDALTVNEENRLQRRVQELSQKVESGDVKDRKIEMLERKQEKFERLFQSLIDSGALAPDAGSQAKLPP
jgi:hypothetical protein